MKIIKVESEDDLELCSKLRKMVFGDEEQAPKALYIIDDYDRLSTTCNYLGKVDDTPVSTIRFIKVDDTTVKLQRLVVPAEYRGHGYAKEILEYLEKDAYSLGYRKIIMDSALKSVGFYEKYGYTKESDVFYEDDRPHVKMLKKL